MTVLFSFVFALFTALNLVSSSQVSSSHSVVRVASSCGDPISCLLSQVVINIPNITIPVNGNNLTVTNLVCKNLALYSIPSEYDAPTTLDVGLEDIALSCEGNYHYQLFKGIVDIKINQTTAELAIDFVKEDIYPVATNVTFCDLPSIDINIKFQGNIGTNLLNALAAALKGAIEKEVYDIVCVDIVHQINVNGTNTLVNNVDPLLFFIVNAPPLSIPTFGDDVFSWEDIGRLNSLKSLLSQPLLDTIIDLLTGGTGSISASINQTIPVGKNFLLLNSLSISGLDQFNNISIVGPSPSSPIAILSTFSLEKLDIIVNMSFVASTQPVYVENLQLVLKLSDLVFSLETALALSKSGVSSLYLDQLTQTRCLLGAVEYLNVSSLTLKAVVADFAIVQVSGSTGQLETDLVNLIDNIVELFVKGYSELITGVISGVAQGIIRPIINEKLQIRYKTKMQTEQCVHDSVDSNQFVVWSNNTLIKLLDKVINEELGPSGLNALITKLTNGTGSISIDTDMADISVSGLNSFNYLDVLEPYSPLAPIFKPYNLMNYIGLGACSSKSCTPLSIRIDINSKKNTSTPSLTDYHFSSGLISRNSTGISLQIDLSNFFLYADLLVEVSLYLIHNLRIQDLSTSGCLAATVEALSISQLRMDVSSASVTSRGGTSDATKTVNSILNLISSAPVVNKINKGLQNRLDIANATCYGVAPTYSPSRTFPNIGGDSDDDDSSTSNLALPFILAGIMAGIVLLVWVYNHFIVPMDTKFLSQPETYPEFLQPIFRHNWSEALIFNQKISFFIRFLIPVLFLIDQILLNQGNADPKSEVVQAEVTIGSKVITLDIADLGVMDTIADFWYSGSYSLAITGAFATYFPWLKSLPQLACFILPPDILSLKLRENIMLVTEGTAKFINITFFVTVFLNLIFYFNINTMIGIDARAFVFPLFGYYENFCGMLGYFAIGHMILGCHRYVQDSELNAVVEKAPKEEEAVINHEFTIHSDLIPASYGGTKIEDTKPILVKISLFGKITFGLIFILAVVLVLFGSISDFFTYTYLGLLGLALRDDSVASYSVVSVGTSLPPSSGFPSTPEVVMLEVFYFIFVLGAPLAMLLLSSILWCIPTSYVFFRRCMIFMEIFHSWSHFDVWVFSIMSGFGEVTIFVNYVIGDLCDGINALLASNDKIDQALDGNDVCLEVDASLSSDSKVAIFGALFLFTYCTITLVAFYVIEHERRHKVHATSTYAHHHRHHQHSNTPVDTGFNGTKEFSAEATASPFHAHELSLKTNLVTYDSLGIDSHQNSADLALAAQRHHKVFKNSVYRRLKRAWVSGLIHLRMLSVVDLGASSSVLITSPANEENSTYKPLAG